MSKYHIDFETYSEADIRKVGTFGYARHPSTQILCLAISRDDREPLLWVAEPWVDRLSQVDPIEQWEASDLVFDLCNDPDAVVCAHNAPFEFAVWNYVATRWPKLRPEQMRCTAAMARRACIPHSLEKCAAYLGLTQQKDTKGKSLIQKMCIPQKPDKTHTETWRRTPTMDPVRFQALCEYCVQDVKVEMQIEKALHLFDAKGLPHEVFVHDLIINDRGFPVDVPALKRAEAMIDEVTSEAHNEFLQLTGFAPTQTKVLLPWLQEHGYKGANLQAVTMEEEMEDWEPDTEEGLDEVAKRALELRQTVSFAAVKKVKSMLLLADPEDSRIRGTLFYHGATTGRWSSKLVQQQNLKRSTKDSEDAFAMLRSGASRDALELVHGPILQTLATCIRHFINDGGEPLDSVDYAAIEARIVCWLAGQEDALEEFRQGIDRYKIMAAKIFRTTVAHITKDQRFVGKQTVLGCGYGMGANKFIGTCESYGQEVSAEVAELAVTTFRETHKEVVGLWYKLEGACKRAILTPGQKIKVGKHLIVFCMTTAGTRFLMIRLPSGRHLSYPEPQLTGDRITFYGQVPGKAMWGRIETYGGKLVENCLTGETLVLTIGGWIPLSELRNQKVHDGVEFVEHGGLLRKGEQGVIEYAGFVATPDHRFASNLGWQSLHCVQAKGGLLLVDEKRINRSIQTSPIQTSQPSWSKIWALAGDCIRLHGWKDLVACAVRLWGSGSQAGIRTSQRTFQGQGAVLFAKMPYPSQQDCHYEDNTWDVTASSMGSVALNEAEVFGLQPPSIQKLWRKGYHYLQKVVGFFREFLGGHGGDLGEGSGFRSQGQQPRLLQGELPLDNQTGELNQQKNERSYFGNVGHSRGEWDFPVHSVLEVEPRSETGHCSEQTPSTRQEVFDIRNCGKRRRFIVKSPITGLVAVAHNCTQGVAADCMGVGAINATRAGHEIIMLVHDEAVRTTRGSAHTLEHFIKCLTDMPAWAEGLPLVAEGETIPYYRK